MCPHNDLTPIDIDLMVETFQSGYNESASDDCSILSNPEQCVSSFTLDTLASTWYNPGQLPSGFPGTEPLSTTTDAGSLTSAPDPYTFSIFPSYITVITPAPYNAKNAAAADGSSVSSGDSGSLASSASSGSTSTATGNSAASTSKGAAVNIVSPISFNIGIWGLATYTVVCAVFGAALIL
ncbi:hypothetical protein N7454_010669 [Penicillium verhagenii]|nr:hypothetical protein N7454_010669 [Penicillium verhagenii]